MQQIECPSCRKSFCVPSCLSCPMCHRKMTDHTEQYIHDHIKRCAISLNPNIVTNHKRGRPSKKEYSLIEPPDAIPVYRRACTNCSSHCSGNDRNQACDRWSKKPLSRCRGCGNLPTEIKSNGILVKIVCLNCHITYDGIEYRWCEEELTDRWNRINS